MGALRVILLCSLAGCSGTTGDVLLGGDAGADLALTDGARPDGMPPMAVIYHPADNEVRAAGTAIPFVGHATDPQDGALTGNSLVWTSSIDNQFGTGEMFSATLSTGVHKITLTATDSIGLTATASITLTVN